MVTSASTASPRVYNQENRLIPLSIVLSSVGTIYLLDTKLSSLVSDYTFTPYGGLHNPWLPSLAVVGYLMMVLFLPKVMENHKPLNLKYLMVAHNYFLSYLSLVMLIGFTREVYNIATRTGTYGLFCDVDYQHAKTPLYFWYFIFYLSKMYEFIDTLILCLRKKKLIFLHVYHHIITLFLCWICMVDNLSVQWISAAANTMVHVPMYYFYACQSLQIDVWWKKHLTSLQIFQFVLDISSSISWAYFVVVEGQSCAGSWTSFWIGQSVLASFLVLFINFFVKTYTDKGRSKAQAGKDE